MTDEPLMTGRGVEPLLAALADRAARRERDEQQLLLEADIDERIARALASHAAARTALPRA